MSIQDIATDMAAKATEIDPLGKKLLFLLDDEKMLVDGTGDTNEVTVVSDQDIECECTVRMSIDTYLKLQRKEIKPLMAVASGKVKVKGDLAIAKKLKQLM